MLYIMEQMKKEKKEEKTEMTVLKLNNSLQTCDGQAARAVPSGRECLRNVMATFAPLDATSSWWIKIYIVPCAGVQARQDEQEL